MHSLLKFKLKFSMGGIEDFKTICRVRWGEEEEGEGGGEVQKFTFRKA